VALDTNVLAYAEGVNGAGMKQAALEIVEKLPTGTILLPVQALGELFNLLVRKAGWLPAKARSAILSWQDPFPLIETSAQVMVGAADLSTDHQFAIWDAVVFSAAAEAGCRLLLSEDMHDGFTWRGVTVTNPFSARKHEVLATLLAGKPESH
jgi:predicted nucleic acid-binding protein